MGRVDAGVDNKLGHGEVLVPVILSSTDIKAEVLFDLLVGVLCLSIGLGMVCSSEVGLDAKMLQEGVHDIGGKLWPSVTDKAKGQPMQTEDLLVVDVHLLRTEEDNYVYSYFIYFSVCIIGNGTAFSMAIVDPPMRDPWSEQ